MCQKKTEGFDITQEEVIHAIRDVRRNATEKKFNQLWRHFSSIIDQIGSDRVNLAETLGMFIIRIQNRKDPSEGYDLIAMGSNSNQINSLIARLDEKFNETPYRADLSNDLRKLVNQMITKQKLRNKYRNIKGLPPIPQLQTDTNCHLNMAIPKCPVNGQTAFCTSTGWTCPTMWVDMENNADELPVVNDQSQGI